MSAVLFAPDHPFTVVLVDKETGSEAGRVETTAELLAGAVLSVRITWNALAVSGGTRWVRPSDGRTFPRGLGLRIETLHPASGELCEIDPKEVL